MTKRTIDQLKAAFAPPEKNNADYEDSSERRDFYKFWKMEIDQQAIVRFLPDLDADNPMGFITENVFHNLTINGKWRKVPCLYHNHGEVCPVCAQAQKFYAEDGDDLSGMGKKYYKKREYLAQIIVNDSPFEINEEPLVKLISIGPKIFKLIQASFSSGDLEEAPYEFKGGYDFRIVKSKNGDWADYTLSKFVPKQSDVDDDTIAQVAESMYNLGDQRTTYVEPEALEALLNAALTGEDVQEAAPAETSETSASSADVTPAEVNAVTATPATKTEAPVSEAPNKANDILDKIRAKAAAKKAANA